MALPGPTGLFEPKPESAAPSLAGTSLPQFWDILCKERRHSQVAPGQSICHSSPGSAALSRMRDGI